jgi:DNA-binding winged helix-turn-helix (wHTH) protein/tetratricopeptide (TPR) repeat protein
MSLYRFAGFALDPKARTLQRAGQPVAVEPRVFDLIVYLIEQRQRAIGRDELIAAAWGRVDCSDGTLAQAVLKARRLLDDDGHAQRAIRTVARFGYQWVASVAIDDDVSAAAAVPDLPPAAAAATPSLADDLPLRRFARRRWTLAAALTGIAAIALLAMLAWRAPTKSAFRARPVPGLVLVAPATVRSAIAQDGWMRLGLMAMSADALRDLPGHSLVPSESVLTAVAAAPEASPERLREATGASTLVLIEAQRSQAQWTLNATLLGTNGQTQIVSAENGDATAAAAALAERIRGALGGSERSESSTSPEALATAARMQAAILEGHAERALDLAAASTVGDEPEVALLRAKALNRLGRADVAIAAMRALVARAGTAHPPWLPTAWSTLGYGELLLGHDAAAQQAFHTAIAQAGGDRAELARGWRGLGNAQAAGGAYADAEASFHRARLELGEDGDRLLLAHIDDDLGTTLARRGRYDEAIASYRRAADAAAAIGATEIELGARMNVAMALDEELRHADALAAWHDLLPRLNALDYPAMQRFAAVHHAEVLAETGAFAAARAELGRVSNAATSDNALSDASLGALRVERLLGDDAAVRGPAVEIAQKAAEPATRIGAAVVRLMSDLAVGDLASARADAALLSAAGEPPDDATRALIRVAQAALHVRSGETQAAQADYREALARVRDSGSPRQLRDVAIPYAYLQLAQGDEETARMLAGLIEAHAGDDFASTLLLARLAAARQPAEAARLYERARKLAGARPLPPLDTDRRATLAAATTMP